MCTWRYAHRSLTLAMSNFRPFTWYFPADGTDVPNARIPIFGLSFDRRQWREPVRTFIREHKYRIATVSQIKIHGFNSKTDQYAQWTLHKERDRNWRIVQRIVFPHCEEKWTECEKEILLKLIRLHRFWCRLSLPKYYLPLQWIK